MSTEPVWTQPEPGRRRARHTREQIAVAALKIADSEGIDAVSMRRVAAELDAGTMTLYHYVSSKRDLLTLMNDAIAAELLIPEEELERNWRRALAQIAHRSRATWQRHPWSIGSLQDAQLGPNGMRHFEQLLVAVADMPADSEEKLALITLVYDYVLGFVIRGDLFPVSRDDEWLQAVGGYISTQLGTGEFPHVQELVGAGDREAVIRWLTTQATADDRFDDGLRRLLDAIALHIDR